MTVRTMTGVLAAVVAALFSLGLGGCGGAVRHDINVTRDESLKDMSVQVDLVGISNPTVKDSVMTCDINKYWAADGNLRSTNAHHSMAFVGGGPSTQSFTRSDPIWEKWGSPNSIVVIAFIPGVTGDKGVDRRRIEIPLESGYWKERTLDVRVDSQGVKVLTPSKGGY